jgi:molecular chaperone GrpE (heat shock protein)
MNEKSGYWRGVLEALLGRSSPGTTRAGAAESRIRTLEIDVEDRDRRIEQMRREYAGLQASRDRDAGDAGRDQVARVFKRLAGTLSNLSALAAYQEAGRDVSAADFAALARSLEKDFAKAGLERIGAPGETAAFDASLHQRMSGGTVRDGVSVTVRIPGYRVGKQVLIKAMVAGPEDSHA